MKIKQYDRFIILGMSVILFGSLLSCSVDENFYEDASPDPPLQLGILYDSEIDGMNYETPTHSGVTSNGGRFFYRANEPIKFKIGTLQIGDQVLAKDMMSPVDLVRETMKVEHRKVVNIARFIQTLDTEDPENPDEEPSTRIVITDEVKKKVETLGEINFDQETTTFKEDEKIKKMENDLAKTLVDETTAVNHLIGNIKTKEKTIEKEETIEHVITRLKNYPIAAYFEEKLSEDDIKANKTPRLVEKICVSVKLKQSVTSFAPIFHITKEERYISPALTIQADIEKDIPFPTNMEFFNGFRMDVELTPGINIYRIVAYRYDQIIAEKTIEIDYQPNDTSKYNHSMLYSCSPYTKFPETIVIDLTEKLILGIIPDINIVAHTQIDQNSFLIDTNGNVYRPTDYRVVDQKGNAKYNDIYTINSMEYYVTIIEDQNHKIKKIDTGYGRVIIENNGLIKVINSENKISMLKSNELDLCILDKNGALIDSEGIITVASEASGHTVAIIDMNGIIIDTTASIADTGKISVYQDRSDNLWVTLRKEDMNNVLVNVALNGDRWIQEIGKKELIVESVPGGCDSSINESNCNIIKYKNEIGNLIIVIDEKGNLSMTDNENNTYNITKENFLIAPLPFSETKDVYPVCYQYDGATYCANDTELVNFNTRLLVQSNFPDDFDSRYGTPHLNGSSLMYASKKSINIDVVELDASYNLFKRINLATNQEENSPLTPLKDTTLRPIWGHGAIAPNNKVGVISTCSKNYGAIDVINVVTGEVYQSHDTLSDNMGRIVFSGDYAFIGSSGNGHFGGGGIYVMQVNSSSDTGRMLSYYPIYGASMLIIGPDNYLYASSRYIDPFNQTLDNRNNALNTRYRRGVDVMSFENPSNLSLVKTYYLHYFDESIFCIKP